MGRLSVLGLMLTMLCAITSDYASYGATRFSNCSENDLDALIDFKNGLEDPEDRLASWKGGNCCQWHGISCDDDTGAVVAINLGNPYHAVNSDSSGRYGFWNLSGELRPSLIKLKSLEYLDLSFNTFNDISIPEFLGSLENLQYLNLSEAGFTGVVPPSLGNLPRLQYFDVSAELFALSAESLDWLTGLVSLKHLAMNRVDLSLVGSEWLGILNNLPNLTELHLSVCGLTGSITSISPVNLTSLAVLDLSLNHFNSLFPNWLVNISALVYVDLSDCALYGRIPIGFGELPNLQYLSLAGNNNLSASCSQLFRGSWKKIQILNFASNKLHGKLPSSVANMTSLTNFDLFDNKVEGGIPSSIARLCYLKEFDLSGNNLTGSLPEILQGTDLCVSSNSPLPSLMSMRLGNNYLKGKLPEWLSQLQNLVELTLSFNLLQGPIPASLGNLKNLTELDLAGNQLNGSLPETLGSLPELSILDVSSNSLTGIVSEIHFSRLSKLKFLGLSSNSFILNVSSSWIPPFQVQSLNMRSCQLGPLFPSWIKTQQEVSFLDFSNASISGPIPNWFWDISINLSLLNVSLNQLQGQLPNPLNIAPFADVDFRSNLLEGPIPLPIVEIALLDLSNNYFSGLIPRNISESMPNLIFLSVSGNRLTGEIPGSIGEMQLLQVIDLSRNNISGSIPSSIGNCTFLKVLDLSYNNLSGVILASLSQLTQLQSLHLNNNKITGNLPSSFQNLTSLETLDLGNNRFSGNIPSLLGDGFAGLRILSLRSNAFSGEIPSKLSNLSSLQVLDLAENDLRGSIPGSLGDLKAMAQVQNVVEYLLFGRYRGIYYEENLVINTKGQQQRYTKTLSLVTSIDLSGNNLHGDFPIRLTELVGLVVLNLSRNHISGQIPENVSDLHQLASLDLSSNNLSGAIPSSLSSLSFLGYINLSGNRLAGKIPFEGHMTTFDASSYAGNPGLCGDPLPVKCQDDESEKGGNVVEDDNEVDNEDEFIDKWFYLSLGLGFASGIIVPTVILSIKTPYGDAYFKFVEKIVGRLS